MSRKVTSLPGDSCLFYKSGRCHYEEALNPGFHSRFRCKLLVLWESKFEDFISRAEKFGLNPEEAGRIWSERMEGLYSDVRCCNQFQREDSSSDIQCRHAYQDICLLLLPPCQGQCRHYKPRGKMDLKQLPDDET